MTRAQALRKARKLFGKTAAISAAKCCTREYYVAHNSEKGAKHFERFFGKMRYTVGTVLYGSFFEVCGTGLSWEECFEGIETK